MYYKRFINFLKEHQLYNESALAYWKDNKICFDYKDDEKRDLIGCYYLFENDILTKINLIVPFIIDEKTILINIHEYIHFILLYNQLGKKYKIEKDKEILPLYYEKLYIEENKNKELLDYYHYLNESIKQGNIEEYKIALYISDKLLKDYKINNIYKLEKKAKRLIKKYN